MDGCFLPRVASVISTLKTTADRRNALGHARFRILLSNRNMQLLFSVSPPGIPDLSQVAICSSPLGRKLKGTNDSCSTDGSAPCACQPADFSDAGSERLGVAVWIHPSPPHRMGEGRWTHLRKECFPRLVSALQDKLLKACPSERKHHSATWYDQWKRWYFLTIKTNVHQQWTTDRYYEKNPVIFQNKTFFIYDLKLTM